MEKAYRNIAYLFAALFVLVFIGFYKTYFGLFPTFREVATAAHYHAIALIIWSLLIIIQPLLIKAKKLSLHRTLGKFSYILSPVIVLTTLALARHMFLARLGQIPKEANLANLFLPFSHMLLFSLFYSLAIIYKRPSALHMRYMIAASFVVLAPAIVRINFSWISANFNSLLFSYVVTDFLLLLLIAYDLRNKKKYKPYLIALLLFLAIHVSTFYLPETPLWQSFANKIVQQFF